MNNKRMSFRLPIFFLMAFLLFSNGCKEPVDLKSKWTDKEILIDADDSDWKDYPFSYDEETRSLIGLYNDKANFYICFQVMDEGIQRQIMSQGLLIWFNQTGDKNRQWAIKHPVGRDPGDLGGPPPWSSDMPKPPTRDASDTPGPSQDRGSFGRKRPPGGDFGRSPAPYPELRILISKKDEKGKRYVFKEAADIGIYVKCAIDQRNRLIYELKMPLLKSDKTPYAAATSEANTVGIGFMTIKSKDRPQGGDRGGRGRRGGPPGGGGPGGGMPPGGGGTGGGMPPGGGGQGSMEGQGNSLKIWTRVTLASKL